jgi:hypothetical protein
VQGRLTQKPLKVHVGSQCARSGAPIQMTIDQDLNIELHGDTVEPIVFVPDVNLWKLEADSIIDDF